MQLAKSVIDVGLSTNDLEPMLRFWQQDVAVRFDHVLPVRHGQKQYRHDEQGSVIKLNHHAEPLPEAAPSGYRELIIAREGLHKPRRPKPQRTPEILWRYYRLRRAILVGRSGLLPGR